jgi:cation transport ATPase
VVAIFLCPRYFDTNNIVAHLLINKLQIISIIESIITYILLLLNFYNMENLFWMFIFFSVCGAIMFVDVWSKEGRTVYKNLDNSLDKNFTRKTSEFIFFLAIFYTIAICIIYILVNYTSILSNNMCWSTILIILMLLTNYLLLYSVDKTFKQVNDFEKFKNDTMTAKMGLPHPEINVITVIKDKIVGIFLHNLTVV